MTTKPIDLSELAADKAARDAVRAEQLAESAPKIAEALGAVVARVVETGDVGTLDVSTWGTGIEADSVGMVRLQRIINLYAKTSPITGYLVRTDGGMMFPTTWTFVISPRVPDPRVTALARMAHDHRNDGRVREE